MIRIADALARSRDRLKKSDEGFTLIELLVVVIIIGILAAIAIPVYIGVQDNAKDSAAKSDLTNAKTAVVAYYTDKGSSAAVPTTAQLTNYGWGTSTETQSLAFKGTPTSTAFCIDAVSKAGATHTFHIDQASGATSGVCP